MFWSAAHTQTRAYTQSDTHTRIERHTQLHTTWQTAARLILQKQRTSTWRQRPALLPAPARPQALLPTCYHPPPPATTKLDDFQLCSASLPPLACLPLSTTWRCKREFVLLFFFFIFLALLATVGNVFTVNRGHLHTHTRILTHTHTDAQGTCICVLYAHIKFYYCHFP